MKREHRYRMTYNSKVSGWVGNTMTAGRRGLPMVSLGLLVCFSVFSLFSCRSGQERDEKQLMEIISHYEKDMAPLQTEIKLMRWQFATTGEEIYQHRCDSLQSIRLALMGDPRIFSKLVDLRENGAVKDEYLVRQLDILYKEYLVYQVGLPELERLTRLDTYLRKKAWQYLSEEPRQEAERILRCSAADEELKDAWDYVKQAGEDLSDSLLLLVRMRNTLARKVGFDNYFEMKVFLDDLDVAYVDSVMEVLDEHTRIPYQLIVKDVQKTVMERYHPQEPRIMPWHMRGNFLQYGWRANGAERDAYYSYVSMVDVATRFYGGVGLDIKDVLMRSDLNGRKKYPVFTCFNIDRSGDVRLLCDITGTENDLRSLMSQAGTAVYVKNIPNTLPYILKIPSSELLRHGVAAFFSRMTGYSNWVLSMGILSVSQAGDLRGTYQKRLKSEQIFWLRWGIMIYEFEKLMYKDPDQDLNSLWMNLVNRYLNVDFEGEGKGKAYWAAENYFILDPCSFHNHILGEIWASQLIHYFCSSDTRNGLEDNPNFVGNERIGEHLKKYVFAAGASKTWDQVTLEATGSELSLDAFLKQFTLVPDSLELFADTVSLCK